MLLKIKHRVLQQDSCTEIFLLQQNAILLHPARSGSGLTQKASFARSCSEQQYSVCYPECFCVDSS